ESVRAPAPIALSHRDPPVVTGRIQRPPAPHSYSFFASSSRSRRSALALPRLAQGLGFQSANAINNPRAPAREKCSDSTNELLENHHERVELGTPNAASETDSKLATVGAVNRAKDGRR
ncbi:MAG: hypothetical protein ACRD8U_00030, partial [Pyrinomonadaceae bacterium]